MSQFMQKLMRHVIQFQGHQSILHLQNQPLNLIQNTMQPLGQLRRMREDFRVSIRRQKKQEIFRTLRSQNKLVFIEQQQKRMINILQTPERRQQWILQKARDLSGQPDQTWRFIMNQLFWSIASFKGKGSFNIWIESGIIKSLCLLFEEDYLSLNLGPQAAKLLGNVIYLEELEQESKTSFVAEQIFGLQVLQNIVTMIEDQSLPHSQISFLVTLVGNLAQNRPSPVIKAGAIKVCMDWSLRILQQNRINKSYLDQIYSFFDLMVLYSHEIPANYNFTIQILNLYTQFIKVNQNSQLLNRILETIIQLLKKYKSSAYKLVLNNVTLMKKLMALSTCEHETTRDNCWSIIAYISSIQQIYSFFKYFNFIEVMWEAYAIEPVPHGIFSKITQKMLICIGNIVSERDQMREQILNHPVMNIIYESTHEEGSLTLKRNAYYVLCTFLSTNNYNLIRKILYETPIFEKLVFALDHLISSKDASAVFDIINTLKDVFQNDRQVYRYHEADLLDIVNGKYNLSSILENIQHEYDISRIRDVCDQIFDMFSTN